MNVKCKVCNMTVQEKGTYSAYALCATHGDYILHMYQDNEALSLKSAIQLARIDYKERVQERVSYLQYHINLNNDAMARVLSTQGESSTYRMLWNKQEEMREEIRQLQEGEITVNSSYKELGYI